MAIQLANAITKRLEAWKKGASDMIEDQRPTDKPDVKKDAKAIRRRGWYLQFSDSAKHYVRGLDGVIRRKTPKVRGKAAVKAAKRARHA